MHLILIPTHHTITHLCFGNEHTIFSCEDEKHDRKKGTVCGVMTFFMLMHLLHVNQYDGNFVRQMCMFPYNLQRQHYMSKMGHQKILYFANHSYREHRSIAFRSLLFYLQMDVADKCLWSTIR